MVAHLAPALDPFDADTLVHGDVTFEKDGAVLSGRLAYRLGS